MRIWEKEEKGKSTRKSKNLMWNKKYNYCLQRGSVVSEPEQHCLTACINRQSPDLSFQCVRWSVSWTLELSYALSPKDEPIRNQTRSLEKKSKKLNLKIQNLKVMHCIPCIIPVFFNSSTWGLRAIRFLSLPLIRTGERRCGIMAHRLRVLTCFLSTWQGLVILKLLII